MKRTFVFLLSLFVLSFAALASASQERSQFFTAHAQAQQNPENLSKHQLQKLIATARTPAEHTRIAQYYRGKALEYLAQSRKHEEMAAQYMASPVGGSSKLATGTVNHCVILARRLKANAAKMQKLAQDHEQMAREAGQR